MNKNELIEFIANKENCAKSEAEAIINAFTSSVISAVSEGHEISLVGFGSFNISKVEARPGINPKTKEPIQIDSYNQVRFKVGQKLKDAVNNDKSDKKSKKDDSKKTKSK